MVDMDFWHYVETRECKTPCHISNLSTEVRPLYCKFLSMFHIFSADFEINCPFI